MVLIFFMFYDIIRGYDNYVLMSFEDDMYINALSHESTNSFEPQNMNSMCS